MNETLSLPFFGKLLTVKLPSIPTIQRVLYQLRLHYGYIKPSPLPLIKTLTSMTSSPPLPCCATLSHSQGATSNRSTHASSIHLTDEQYRTQKRIDDDDDDDDDDEHFPRRSNSVSFFSTPSSSQQMTHHHQRDNPLLSPTLPPRPTANTPTPTPTHPRDSNRTNRPVYGVWDESSPRVSNPACDQMNQECNSVREEIEEEKSKGVITEEERKGVLEAADEWFAWRMNCWRGEGEQKHGSYESFSSSSSFIFNGCRITDMSTNSNNNNNVNDINNSLSYPIIDGPFTVYL